MSKRRKLSQVEKQTGKKLVEEPEIPDGAEYLWAWFWDIAQVGAENVTAQEIKAWSDMTGNVLERWEFEALRAMAQALNAEIREKERAGRRNARDQGR